MQLTFSDPRLPADGYEVATTVANQAFSLGIIDLEQLDSTLSKVASAATDSDALAVVAPLQPQLAAVTSKNPVPQNPYGVQKPTSTRVISGALSAPFYVMAGVTALNVVIWTIVSVMSGFVYFWPIWLCIPLFIFFLLHLVGKKINHNEVDGIERRQLDR